MTRNEKGIDKKIVITGIIALAVMSMVAMAFGIDGTFRSTIVGLIALAIGFTLPSPIKK